MNEHNPYAPPQAELEQEPLRVMRTPNVGEPAGLGGWLFLVAIGLVVGPFRLLAYLVQTYPPLFRDGTWEGLTDPASEQYIPLFAAFLIVEIVINVAFIVGMVMLAIQFFRRSRLFPKTYIGFLIANLVFIVGDAIVGTRLMQTEQVFDGDTGRELGRSVLAVMIWIPYMRVSKRVKNTFIE